MGLIYVNPEGPNGKPDPIAAAKDIREAFGRMAMDDAETVALIAGGHSFGKAHGAHKPDECVGELPAKAGLEEQGFGWKNKCGTGKGADAITSGLEGAWTATPVHFSMGYLNNLFNHEWKQTKTPGGAVQWVPKDGADVVPDAHDKTKRHPFMMFTTDIALKEDPSYQKIAKSFMEKPVEFEKAFARGWFKLTHRDMGPRARYLGSEVPKESYPWQDPVAAGSTKSLSAGDIAAIKSRLLKSGLTVPQLVRTAWASASTFRGTDKRGGANGARIRLLPQRNWAVNDPEELGKVLSALEKIQKEFGKKLSMADLIVIGGNAAVEKAAKDAGHAVKVPFTPGRMDATEEQTDAASFEVLEPKADAFRNYYSEASYFPPLESLVEKANLLTLTVPEMTVLIAGMRSLGANAAGSKHGLFVKQPGTLSNEYFVNLLDMSTEWRKSKTEGLYEGVDRKTGAMKYTATSIDLIFGSHSELRAIAEVYASNDSKTRFVEDFAKAWNKVMMLDRFDAR